MEAREGSTILDAPAKFVEIPVSFLISRTPNWHPAAFYSWSWQSLVYPVYALPAWFYIGLGIDALFGRRRVGRSNMIFSVVIAVAFAVMCCGLEFGISAAERQGQERLTWYIKGFALWAALFVIPCAAWVRQKYRRSAF